MPGGPDPILVFFGGGGDHAGRTLAQILAWDDERLEAVHDYIQWLFPTRQPSAVNPSAPRVTGDTVAAFRRDERLRGQLRAGFGRMLAFYGLRRAASGGIEIDRERFDARADVWLHPGNHNHLRLTRIMDSLSTLCLRGDAAALQRCLIDEIAVQWPARVSPRTIEFWRAALAA